MSRPRGGDGRRLILATDLDGTLLGGSDEDRERLAELFAAEEGFRVVFLTGRGLETIRPCLEDPLVPAPDYIVGDVGATVVSARDMTPVQPLQEEIERAWPGRRAVERALEPFSFLERQEVPQERRCSYRVAGAELISRELLEALEEIGCSGLFSAGRYLDVLPRGVSKGSTLSALLRIEGLDPEAVVVAGDSLNDLSLFETGLKGVAVGNSEDGLERRVADMESVFLARRDGAGGILEGLEHHRFLEGAEAAAVG